MIPIAFLVLMLKNHSVFHVSRLQELLGFNNNTFTIETHYTFKDLTSKPHVLKFSMLKENIYILKQAEGFKSHG